MRILVTGAGGLLGAAFASIAIGSHDVRASYSQHTPRYGKPVRADLATSGTGTALVGSVKPDVVVHAAALTDVDVCESNKALARRVNTESTGEIARAAAKLGAFMVYLSTDYVFDGTRGLYSESDAPNPLNFYGITKLRGEKMVTETCPEYAIARASVIYGRTATAGKSNSALWLLDKLAKGETANVIIDQYVSPTLNTGLAKMILEIAEKRMSGVFHLAGADRVSRMGFAECLCDVFDLPRALLNPVRMRDMDWKARRPRDSSLDVSKATSDLRVKPLGLSEALSDLKRTISAGGHG